ncbi:MAG TPA: BrnT family toxin [bacterium]|jgi:uncharacterized DUF497 family protein|nr:BrnT family toxin [bacterium]
MAALEHQFSGFVWDEKNLDQNLAKHGVDRANIEAMFRHGARWFRDDQDGHAGARCLAMGRDARGRPMVVAFDLLTLGPTPLLRPISARRLKVKEARRYA